MGSTGPRLPQLLLHVHVTDKMEDGGAQGPGRLHLPVIDNMEDGGHRAQDLAPFAFSCD